MSLPLPSTVRYARAFLFLALALTLLLYLPGLDGPFLLDDAHTAATVGKPGSLSPGDLVEAIHDRRVGIFGRPLSYLTFAANRYFGADPLGFKWVNLLLHLANGLLLYTLTSRLLGRVGKASAARNHWVAAIAAAFWLLHPLQVSTVLYVVQRMAQLSAFFTLLALLAYVVGRQRFGGTARAPILTGVAVGGTATLAFLSKETGALIPLYLLLIEGLFFRGAKPARERFHGRAFLTLFAYLPLAAGSVYFLLEWERYLGYGGRDFTLVERLMTQAEVVLFYLRLIILPHLGSMGLFHDGFPTVTAPDWGFLLSAGALAGLAAVALRYRRRAPVLSFGIGWFFVSHLLESTVFPLEMVFEHRNYLALYGPAMMIAWYLLPARWSRDTFTRLRLGAVGAVLLLLGLQTGIRVDSWSDELAFYRVAVLDNPDSARARMHYANVLEQRGHPEKALAQLQAGERVAPGEAGFALAQLLLTCREGAQRELIGRAATKLRGGLLSPYAYNTLARLIKLVRDDVCAHPAPEDLVHLARAATENVSPNAKRFLILLGRAYETANRLPEAVALYQELIRRSPDDPQPYIELAWAYAGQRDVGKLAAQLDRLGERFPETHRRENVQKLERRLAELKAAAAEPR